MRFKLFTLCQFAVNDGECMLCPDTKECSEACELMCIGCIHEEECDYRTKSQKKSRGWCYTREDKE